MFSEKKTYLSSKFKFKKIERDENIDNIFEVREASVLRFKVNAIRYNHYFAEDGP